MSNLGNITSLLGSSRSASNGVLASLGMGSGQSRTDFASSLSQQLARMQAQSLSSLLGTSGDAGSDAFGFLSKSDGPDDLLSLLGASQNSPLNANGRNMALADPESGYRMMSIINRQDVNYKAQYAELTEMQQGVYAMQRAGEKLQSLDGGQDDGAIASALQSFVSEYNNWVSRFDPTVQDGGILDGTQAAEFSLHTLERNIENVLNGAAYGFRGLEDLGLSVDQRSNQLSLDSAKLQQALAGNREGVVNTIQQFSSDFAESAKMLNAEKNLIPNRLVNLDRVIDFINENKASLQQEFGQGEPAKPPAYVAQALDAYNRISRGY